jgi:hypothetical protein
LNADDLIEVRPAPEKNNSKGQKHVSKEGYLYVGRAAVGNVGFAGIWISAAASTTAVMRAPCS